MNKSHIVVIGGANIEYIVKSKSHIIHGSKNFVDIEELYGGSGLNYALRLINAGYDVYPLLYIGNDSIGHNIKRYLLNSTKKDTPTFDYIQRDDFYVDHLNTIRSIIIVEGSSRTILAQDQNMKNLFLPSLISQIKNIDDNFTSIVIGHIHNDNMQINSDISQLSTAYIIDFFSLSDKFIYCNLGSTQLEYGYNYWKEKLRSIDILQLNIVEVRSFFKVDGITPTLFEIVKMLSDLDISCIITLDKFGAIGFIPTVKDTIYMARVVDLGNDFVDSTGAGDAFCSGMISVLNGNKDFTPDEFKHAMEVARSWAVYACKSYGGANNCPSLGTIEAFHHKINHKNEVLEYKDDMMIDILSLIDNSFSGQL